MTGPQSRAGAADDAHAAAAQQEWDERYREQDRIWSGRPNATLVEQVGDLTPGRALDAGAGEGADACWLAARGWRVTGVELSEVALERAVAHARTAGVDVDWVHADLSREPAPGTFDLVSAHYLHVGGPRGTALREHLIAAVAPGGRLLVVTHDPRDHRVAEHRAAHPDRDFGEEIWDSAALIDALGAGWTVEVDQAGERPDGDQVRYDRVLRAVRVRSVQTSEA